MKKFFFTIICSLFVAFAFAQSNDKIIKTDGTEILCKVKEIGQYEIKYTKADNPDGPLYSIPKSEVRKIVFANGTEEVIQQNTMSVMPSKNRNYKRAITTRPFGPLIGFISVGYQQALTPSRAIIGELGWIGPHVGSMTEEATGGYIRVGYRLKRTPEIVMQGMEWGYNLGGFYVQPELCFSAFTRTVTATNWVYNQQTGQYNSVTETRTGSYSSGAFMIGVGRQMIVGEIVTFDLGASAGYAFTSKPSTSGGFYEFNSPVYYSHSAGDESFPIAWKFTLSMGILMK